MTTRHSGEGALRAAVDFVSRHQRPDGAITWYRADHSDRRLDPWDHVECAMALDAGGEHEAASAAYRWVADQQLEDGALYATYDGDDPVDRAKDSNVSTYIAVGAWHRYLRTENADSLVELWPVVQQALAFAISLQAPAGEVYWAANDDGTVWQDCQLAGAASVHSALVCGQRIAARLGMPEAESWSRAADRLATALVDREAEFGTTFPEHPSRYAMHWYYPVLGGVVRGDAARRRLSSEWSRFVEDGDGCRCTNDRGWVTVAESSELSLALDAAGETQLAGDVLNWQLAGQHDDGGFDMGRVEGYGAWPEGYRPSWTAAAVVLAIDAVHELTPAGGLFRSLGSARI